MAMVDAASPGSHAHAMQGSLPWCSPEPTHFGPATPTGFHGYLAKGSLHLLMPRGSVTVWEGS